MYDDVKPSDYIEATADSIAKILPAPDIRLELVWMNSVGFYRYRVLLENLDAYKDFSDWTVSVKAAGISAELTKNSPVAYIEGIDFNTGYQMISQASSKETGVVNSSQVSETVVLPKYNLKSDSSLVGVLMSNSICYNRRQYNRRFVRYSKIKRYSRYGY